MNVDDVRQIIFRANGSNRNIREVYLGGDPPTLLWPKNYIYTIVDVVWHYPNGSSGTVHPKGSIVDTNNYAYATGTIQVETQTGVFRPSIYDAVLTPISFGDSNQYVEGGVTKSIFYTDDNKIKANNIGTYPINNTTAIPVTLGYMSANLVESTVFIGANTCETSIVKETTGLDIRFYNSSAVTLPAGGGNYEFSVVRIYDDYTKESWTSGANVYTLLNTDQEDPLNATTFSAVNNNTGTTIGTRWSDHNSVIVTIPSNNSTNSQVYKLSASYQTTDRYGNQITVEDELLVRQSAGAYTYGPIIIDAFYYAKFNSSGTLIEGTIIPASGNSGSSDSPIYPVAIKFHQGFGWNGNTNTWIFDSTNYGGSITGRHSVTLTAYNNGQAINTRTYTLDYLSATNPNTGAVTRNSKWKTVDTTTDDWTIEGTVGLTITDQDNISGNAGATNIYQQANRMTITTIRNWYTSGYKLYFMTEGGDYITDSEDSSTLSIGRSGRVVMVKSSVKQSIDKRRTWTSGATPEDFTEDSWGSQTSCSSFTVTGSGYTKSGSKLTFNENTTLSSRSFTVSDSYSGFNATINIAQDAGVYVYSSPIINSFSYQVAEIGGGYIYPTLEFIQGRYINVVDSYHKIDDITGSINPSNYTSRTASDGSTFTITYNYTTVNGNANGRVSVSARPNDEDGTQGSTVNIGRVSAIVKCHNLDSSNNVTTNVYQKQNYAISYRYVLNSYTIAWVNTGSETNCRFDATGGTSEGYIKGIWNISKLTKYASRPSVEVSSSVDVPNDKPSSITPTMTSGDGRFFLVNYNSSTGKVTLTPDGCTGNESDNPMSYSITGTSSNSYTGSANSSNSITATVSAGTKTYGAVTISQFYYDTVRSDVTTLCHVYASGGNATYTLVYYQYWGWNGSTIQDDNHKITSGASLSFTGNIASYATLNSNGTVYANSLGTNEILSRQLASNINVTVTLNGKTNNRTSTDIIYQEANVKKLMAASDIALSIGGTTIGVPHTLNNYYSSKVAVVPTVSVKYGYTAWNYDISTTGRYTTDTITRTGMSARFVQNEYVQYDTGRTQYNSTTHQWEPVYAWHWEDVYKGSSLGWLSLSATSSKWEFTVTENDGALRGNANDGPHGGNLRLEVNYANGEVTASKQFGFKQAAAVYSLQPQGASTNIAIGDTDTTFSYKFTSIKNTHPYAITASMVTWNSNNINASVSGITTINAEEGIYTINFSCDYNTSYSQRTAQFTVNNGQSVTRTVTQAAFVAPTISAPAYFVGTGTISITASHSWEVVSLQTWDYDSNSLVEQVSSDVLYTVYSNSIKINRNTLSGTNVGHLKLRCGPKNNTWSYAYILIVPTYSISINTTNVHITNAANNNVAYVTSTYPINTGTISSGASSWLRWDGTTVKAVANTNSSERTGTATMRGSVNIESQGSYSGYSTDSNNVSVTVTQEALIVEDSISISPTSWTYNTGDLTRLLVTVTSSGNWTCDYDSEYFTVTPDSGTSSETSCSVRIKPSTAGGSTHRINFECGAASATLVVDATNV